MENASGSDFISQWRIWREYSTLTRTLPHASFGAPFHTEVRMRTFLIACILIASRAVPASAEPAEIDEKHIESENELGFVVPIGEGRFGHRSVSRLSLNVDD